MLLQLAQQHAQEMLGVVVVAERCKLLHVAAGHILHQQRVGDAIEGNGRDHDHLAMSGRHRERDIHGIRLPHAGVEADAQAALRLRVRRMLRPVGEELAKRPLAGRHHQKIETCDERTDIALFDAAVFDLAAAPREIIHQRRKIYPVVDGAARPREIAAKTERLRKIEDMIVVVVMVLRIGPVIDAEIIFPRDRHVVMRHGVEEPAVPVILRRAIGDDGRVHPVLLQVERQMQTCDSRADDADVACHVRPPRCLILAKPSGRPACRLRNR